jgi:DNA-binding LytR/AlgR family response regulator
MRCIIIDDEPLAREGMELMFLDIQMQGITGVEWLKDLKAPPLVIFTTAYPEFAMKGFELNVVDYLLKAIRLNRFMKAVNKAKEIHDLKNQEIQPVITTTESKPDLDYIYVLADRKINCHLLFCSDQ